MRKLGRGEAAETQTWIEFAVKCGYLQRDHGRLLYLTYDEVLRTLVGMINHPETWIIKPTDKAIHDDREEYLDFL